MNEGPRQSKCFCCGGGDVQTHTYAADGGGAQGAAKSLAEHIRGRDLQTLPLPSNCYQIFQLFSETKLLSFCPSPPSTPPPPQLTPRLHLHIKRTKETHGHGGSGGGGKEEDG